MDNQRTVLLTGASGDVGSGFRDEYCARYRGAYRLRLGVREPGFRDDRFDDIARLEIEDLASCEKACAGADTVVHLAAEPDPDADFCAELVGPNVIGAWNMFEAARRARCRRVVYASSVQAIMGNPVDYQAHASEPPRPATMYGATKAFGEALCSVFSYSHSLSCIAVRIGAYVGDDDRDKVDKSANPQLLDIVVSQRDLAQLLHLCITAPDDVRYAVVNGLSDNRFKRMDLESTRALLGYAPEDDAFEWSDRVKFGPEARV